ncbi:MAG: helix-turn-helix domain-containing protein [Bdellovibrionaceae bacterium]|nr:helix-turn-helix domain-containing protein [Bdellovibrionales bacterium]MCB9085997.1 helix-turn-helix domain-containing protein [Pseudobdellovibrionaceae bacterium]
MVDAHSGGVVALPEKDSTLFDNLVCGLKEISYETGVSENDILKLVRSHRFRNHVCAILLTKEGVAKAWDISTSFVNKLMKYEDLPFCKIGRSVRFPAVEVHAWLQQRRRV